VPANNFPVVDVPDDRRKCWTELGEWTGGDPGSRGVMNAGKTVMVGTATWGSGSPGTAELSIDVKMAASYSLADLRGTWQFHTVSSGGGAWWWRATIVIGADGSFLATATESGGSSQTETGQFTISTNGIVSFPGHPAFRGVVDAGKTVLVSTNTWPDGASEMSVGLKMRQ
jgi:hypothetical protein